MMGNYQGVLPPELAADLVRLSRQISASRIDAELLASVVDALGNPPLDRFVLKVEAISYHLDFPGPPINAVFPIWLGRLVPSKSPPLSLERLLDRTPGLEYLGLFHHSGWWREASLKRLSRPLDRAFWIIAVAYRLNDWVPQIRQAAAAAFQRVVMPAPAGAVAEAIVFLAKRTSEWQRWTDEAEVFRAAYSRPDVADEIVHRIARSPTGPMVRVLRDMLRSGSVDHNLLRIGKEAVQPGVRALAMEALLEGRAKWTNGWRTQWIDKSFGLWRRAPVVEARPVVRPCAFDDLLSVTARDPSPLVRKVAARALITNGALATDATRWARQLAGDGNRSVRERAEFFLGRQSGGI